MKPVMVGGVLAAVGFLLATAGCQTESAPASDFNYETRDSADIPIAESTGYPSATDSWVVEAEPFLSIGGVSAAPPAMFTAVTQATRLTDGSIVVLESEASELRFFDAEGRHLRTAGGRGEGPGEFEYAATFARLPGDTLLVDAGSRHISFAANGDYLAEKTIDVMDLIARGAAECGPSALLADGSRLLCDALLPEADNPWGSRAVARVMRVVADGTEVPLGLFVARDPGMLLSSGTWTASGGSPMLVAIVNNPLYSVDVWSADGRLIRIVRRLASRRPPTDAEVEAGLERAMRPLPMGPAPREPEVPDLLPAAVGLTIGLNGDLWVRREPAASLQGASVFDTFDQEGRFRGEVRFDDYFWLYEVGEDYLLGARLDEMGVPHIELHRLSRGQVARSP